LGQSKLKEALPNNFSDGRLTLTYGEYYLVVSEQVQPSTADNQGLRLAVGVNSIAIEEARSYNKTMVLNSLPMLKPSEIIDAKALIVAIDLQSSLPVELQAEFHDIGNTLSADPNYIDRAIQRCIDLVATHPPLQAAFQSAICW
jgi:hypothetical protein